MSRDEETRPISIKRLKRRARELRYSRAIPLAQALESAAKEAGFQTYHHAVTALQPRRSSDQDHEIKLAETAMRRILAFAADHSQYNAMANALTEIYFGPSRSLAEYALAQIATRHPDAVVVLSQWMGAALCDPDLESPRFGINVALSVRAGESRHRPLACAIRDVRTLEARVEEALVDLPCKVALSPVAMLATRPDEGSWIADWMKLTHTACRQAQDWLGRDVTLRPTIGVPRSTGTATGSDYIILGRATTKASFRGTFENALRQLSFNCAPIQALTSAGPEELHPVEVGTADMLVSRLYQQEIDQVSEFWRHVRDDEQRASSNDIEHMDLGIAVRPDGTSHLVDVVVRVPDGPGNPARRRVRQLARQQFPVYLAFALISAFGSVTYEANN